MHATTARELLEALRSEDERRSLAALRLISADPTDDESMHLELVAYFQSQVARLNEATAAAEPGTGAVDTSSREQARRRHICHQALDVITKRNIDVDVLARCRAALGVTHAAEDARVRRGLGDKRLAWLEPHRPTGRFVS